MDDKKETNQFPEAGAVAFFGYKRTDGFEVSLTLKDVDGKGLLKRIDTAIEVIKKQEGTPLPLRGGFTKQSKPIEYVPDRKCPTCGNQLVYAVVRSSGKKFIKCSTNKWNPVTKQPEGCKFVEWPSEQKKEEVPPENEY